MRAGEPRASTHLKMLGSLSTFCAQNLKGIKAFIVLYLVWAGNLRRKDWWLCLSSALHSNLIHHPGIPLSGRKLRDYILLCNVQFEVTFSVRFTVTWSQSGRPPLDVPSTSLRFAL